MSVSETFTKKCVIILITLFVVLPPINPEGHTGNLLTIKEYEHDFSREDADFYMTKQNLASTQFGIE